MQGPKWKLLAINTIRDVCQRLYGFNPTSRTIREVYQEVLEYLAGRGIATPYLCGRCNAAIDADSPECWACGAVIDTGDVADDRMTYAELVERAKIVGVDSTGKTPEQLLTEIEAAETKKRELKKVNLVRMESKTLNERLKGMLPDGWSVGRAKLYTGYVDSMKVKRIAVLDRGLNVHFSVEEGFLDGLENVLYLDTEERKRRHFGRINYIYTGDLIKEVLVPIEMVFAKYGKTA